MSPCHFEKAIGLTGPSGVSTRRPCFAFSCSLGPTAYTEEEAMTQLPLAAAAPTFVCLGLSGSLEVGPNRGVSGRTCLPLPFVPFVGPVGFCCLWGDDIGDCC